MTFIEQQVLEERESQRINPTAKRQDESNTQSDWVAIVTGYIGRASGVVWRNQQSEHDFQDMMIKAAALCIAAAENNPDR